jgi:predicted Zn-dependent protease with MMP-like domain
MEDDDEDDETQDLGGMSFDELEDEVERLAAAAIEPTSEGALRSEDDEDWFTEQVRQAIDDLPDEFLRTLDDVAIVVSDEGRENKAYGLYRGRTVGHEPMIGRPISYALPDEIVIFRDTLTRDFGHDPAQLRAQITDTVRHEIGHHLGLNEAEVRRLGL